jgi:hypothetical protein
VSGPEEHAFAEGYWRDAVAKLEGETLPEAEVETIVWLPKGGEIWETGRPYAVGRGSSLPDGGAAYARKERAAARSRQRQ